MKGKKFVNVFAVLLMLFSLVTSPISALAEGTTDNYDLETNIVDESVELQTEEVLADEVQPKETEQEQQLIETQESLQDEGVLEDSTEESTQEEGQYEESVPEIEAVQINFGGFYFSTFMYEVNSFSFDARDLSDGAVTQDTPLEDDYSLVTDIKVKVSPNADVNTVTYTYGDNYGEVAVQDSVAVIPLKDILNSEEDISLGEFKDFLALTGDFDITFQLLDENGVTTEGSLLFKNTNPDAYDDYWLYINENNKTHNSIEINIGSEGPLESIDVYQNGEFIENISGDTVNYVFSELQSDTEYEIALTGYFEGNVTKKEYYMIQTKLDPSLLHDVNITVQKENDVYSFGFIVLNPSNGDVVTEGNVMENGELYFHNEEYLQLPAGSYEFLIYAWDDYSRHSVYPFEVIEGKENTFNFELNESGMVSQPLNLEITNVTNNSINLSWSNQTNIEDYYLRIYSTRDYETVVETQLDKDISNYELKSLDEDTLYTVELTVRYNDWLNEYEELNIRTSSDSVGEVVEIKDPILKKAIASEVGVQNGEITTKAIKDLTHLDVSYSEVFDLSGLEHATNLEYLNLNDNYIYDISLLTNLKKLIYADLSWNNISDISSLTNLENLEELWLNGNNIQDLESVITLLDAGVEIYYDGLFDGDLFFEIGQVTDKTATINWFINRDVKDVDYIEIYLDGNLVDTLDATSTSYTFTDLDPDMYYNLEVRAYYVDEEWNAVYGDINTDFPEEVKANTQFKIKNFNRDSGIVEFTIDSRTGEWFHHESGKVDDEGYLIDEDGNRLLDVPAYVYEIYFYDSNYEQVGNTFMVRVDKNIDYEKNPIVLDFARKGEVVEFPDENLERAVRGSLGIFNKLITTVDMEYLTNLYADGYEIEELSGLEHAINLDYINLRNNNIKDISVLSKIPSLTNVVLWDNEISDISPLAELSNLKYLDIEMNNVTDISTLSELSNLYQLDISENPIKDFSSLSILKNLEELYIYNLDVDLENEGIRATIKELEDAGITVMYGENYWVYMETLGVTDSSATVEWWMNNDENVDHYNLYLFPWRGSLIEKVEVDPNDNNYTFKDLNASSPYYIVIEAIDKNGEYIGSYENSIFTDDPDLEKKDTTLRILNKEGQAIPSGLEFSIEGTGTDNSHVYLYGVTDKDGYLTNWESNGQTVALPVGTYEVMVFAEGNYQSTIKEIAVSENGENTFDITLPYLEKQTKTIEVSVVDEEGNPVTSVEYLSLYSQGAVQDFGYDAGERYYWDIDSKDGSYTVEDIAVSDNYQYQLNVRADGYITHNQVVQVNENKDVIEVVLGKGLTITGKVEDVNGNPINASYYIYGNNTYEYGELNGQEMKVEGLSLEDLTVEISFPGYQTEVVTVSLDQFVDKSFDLGTVTLQSEKYVHGKVVDEDGNPVRDASINLTRKGSSSYWGNYWTRTDSNGYFKINNVQDGTYKLTSEAYKLPNGEHNDVVPSYDEYTIVLEEQGEGSFAGAGNGLTASKKTVVPGKSLDYQFNYTNNGDATAENVVVTLNVPDSLELLKDTVLLNGEEVTLIGNVITIPSVEAGESGVISFKANVNNDASQSIITIAKITHGENVNTYSSTANVLFVSLNAPAVTASQVVKVYGDAKPGTTVQIYDGDLLLAETSVESKWWYADVVLPVKEGESSTHQLVAKVDDGETVTYSNPVSVSYQPDTPAVTDVTISAGWNQNIKVNPNVGVVTSAIVEFTPIDIRVAFDKDVEAASIGFLGETYELTKDGKEYVTTIPGTWSSYGEQMLDLQFTFDGQEIKVPLMEVIVLIDPSGYVFEGSMDNRLPGVTAVVEEEVAPEKWVKWDAENYGQINPQVTDEDGRYGWDVLSGNWRVIWTKEGYESYISRTVVVPPAETQLNVPMIRTSAPEVTSVTPTDGKTDVALDSEITIEFDRLMNEKDIDKNIQILKDGQSVEGSFTLEGMNGYKETGENAGYFVEDSTKKLSQTVVWSPADEFDYDATYTVVISKSIQDYAGKTLEAAVEQSFTTVSAHEEPTEPGEGTTNPEVEEPTEPGEEATDPEVEEPTDPGEETTDPEVEEPTDPGEETTIPKVVEPTDPGDKTTDPEVEKPSESDKDNTSELKDNQSGEQNDENANEKSKEGNLLPDTSTNMFTWLLFGLALVVIGGAVFFIQRRRNA